MCYGMPSCNEDAASMKEEKRSIVTKLLTFRTHYLIAKLVKLTNELLAECDVACQIFYKNNVEVSLDKAVDIALIFSQGSPEWPAVRSVRFTSVKCYSWLTYWINKKKHRESD